MGGIIGSYETSFKIKSLESGSRIVGGCGRRKISKSSKSSKLGHLSTE